MTGKRVLLLWVGICLWHSARSVIDGGTALVLSGGGAKGAFEAGVLQGICARQPLLRNSWSMVLGTSIGALNAGILAQFSKDEQCFQGMPAVKDYWLSVHSQDDVFISSKPWLTRRCLSGWNTLTGAALSAFVAHGGLCDPSPGAENYHKAVKAENIRNSGMQLRVVASDMQNGEPYWFTELDHDIVDGCMASGSIAPLVYPKEVPEASGNWYVDGGIFANVPIIKALQEGASYVLVILLENVNDSNNSLTNFSQAQMKDQAGIVVLQYYMEVVNNRVFLKNEIQQACSRFPFAGIYAYMPQRPLGDLTDFSQENIAKLMKYGQEVTREEPIDLCAAAGIGRVKVDGRKLWSNSAMVMAVLTSALVSGSLSAFVVRKYCRNSDVRYPDSPGSLSAEGRACELRAVG